MPAPGHVTRVLVVVLMVWSLSWQGGHGLPRPRSHLPTSKEEVKSRSWLFVKNLTPESDLLNEELSNPLVSDITQWLPRLSLLRGTDFSPVLTPLLPSSGSQRLGQVSGVRGQRSEEGTYFRRMDKRGIGLFSLALALGQNPTGAPKAELHPADLSAYPRRARFFVATMG